MKVLSNGFATAALALLLTFNASQARSSNWTWPKPQGRIQDQTSLMRVQFSEPLRTAMALRRVTKTQRSCSAISSVGSAGNKGILFSARFGANGLATTVFIPGPNITVVSQSLIGGSFQIYDSA